MVALLGVSALLLTLAGPGVSGAAPKSGHKQVKGMSDLSRVEIIRLAEPLAQARVATAKYVTDLDAAKADGYRIITQMIPDMGYHFLNPSITGEFDITKPPILVYQRNGDDFHLGALEWVFPEKPKRKPIRGAKYGSFGAACHYLDGTFVFEDSEGDCSDESPESGSPFVFWHPDLVTLHVWLWSPNPDGLFKGTNRWVRPFNDEQVGHSSLNLGLALAI
jgi:hypothetical protein